MKKFFLSEQEKKEIKNLYNLTEDSKYETLIKGVSDYIKGVNSGEIELIKEPSKSTDDKDEKSDEDKDEKSLDDKKTDYSSDKFSKSGDNWMDVTKKVIQKFEGGYWNPICAKYPGTKHPKKAGMYSRSGETMFGLDREAGNIENVSTDGREFFATIDQERRKLGEETFCKTWRWGYIPPDPLKTKLTDLAAKTMKKLFDSNAKAFFKGDTKKVVESSRALLLHFSYATWNGPGFFQKFAKTINKAVEEGKPMKTLIELAKQDRTSKIGGYWAEGTKRVNAAIDQEAQIDGIS